MHISWALRSWKPQFFFCMCQSEFALKTYYTLHISRCYFIHKNRRALPITFPSVCVKCVSFVWTTGIWLVRSLARSSLKKQKERTVKKMQRIWLRHMETRQDWNKRPKINSVWSVWRCGKQWKCITYAHHSEPIILFRYVCTLCVHIASVDDHFFRQWFVQAKLKYCIS